MFKLFQTTLSPKEQYEKELEKLRIEAIEKWEYYDNFSSRPFYSSIVFTNQLLWEYEYYSYNDRIINDKLTKIIRNKKKIIEENSKKQIELKEKQQEDKEYLAKLNKLLKIKPLDKDLQENFKKAEEIIDIWNRIIKDTKRLNFLRK